MLKVGTFLFTLFRYVRIYIYIYITVWYLLSVIDSVCVFVLVCVCVYVCIHIHCTYMSVSVEAPPEYSDHYYGFTQYAIELNEVTDGLEECLPTSDTRFRPDQRCIGKYFYSALSCSDPLKYEISYCFHCIKTFLTTRASLQQHYL